MKILFDLLPLLVFFAAFKFYDIYVATAAAIVATVVQVGWGWVRHRRFEKMHLILLVVLVVLGGLTIGLRDEIFIKWKPTIVNWAFAAVILGCLRFAKKSALEYVLGQQISLPRAVWRKVNLAWAGFFAGVGFLNVYVAFFYDAGAEAEVRTAVWVNFKVFGLTGLTLLFAIAQFGFLYKHIAKREGES